jgi:hypothetical protein
MSKPLGFEQGACAGLPIDNWVENIQAFTRLGQGDWIIGWHQNLCNQLRIKVMRFHNPDDPWPDIKREC